VRSWLLVAAVGCGRIGFGPQSPSDAGDDASVSSPIGFVQAVEPGWRSLAMVTASATVTSGNLLVAATYWHKLNDTITLTDTAGLAWTPLDIADATPLATEAQLWYAPVTVSGPELVTVHQSTSTMPLGIILAEYSGIDLTAPVEAHLGFVTPIATNSITTGAVTVAHRSLVVAFFNDTIGAGTMVPGAGWTGRAWDMGFYVMLQDDAPDGQAPGSVVPDGMLPTGSNDNAWVGVVAAFRTN
jgi:hypothetical protein